MKKLALFLLLEILVVNATAAPSSRTASTFPITGSAGIYGLGCTTAAPTQDQLDRAHAAATTAAFNYCSQAFPQGRAPASVALASGWQVGPRVCKWICPGQGGFGGCQGEPFLADELTISGTFNCTIP